MNAPFYKFDAFGDTAALGVAFAIGLGMGWFLERAGFGSATKLAKQFYFRDLAVLKVMFTAIVTAMVGLFLAAELGWVDLSLMYLQPTVLWANVVGGLLLGVGFIIGGLCPGTSVVSVATGRIDALLFVLGVLASQFLVGEAWPLFAGISEAGEMGQITLPGLLGVPYGLVVLAVVLMAAGAFVAAEWAEVRIGGVERAGQPLLGAGWRARNAPRVLLASLAGLALLGMAGGDPYRGPRVVIDERELALLIQREADHVTVDDLATWIVEGRMEIRLIDLRDPAAHAAGTIPGAENVPLADLPAAGIEPGERVVLFSQGQTHAAQAWMLLRARGVRNAYSLLGGMDEWNDRILFPELPAEPTPDQAAEVERRRALALRFGGSPRVETEAGAPVAAPLPAVPPPAVVTPPAAPIPAAAPAKKKKREGC